MLQRCSSVTLLATIYGHWWRSGMLTRPSDCSAESSFRDYLDISETLTMIRGPTDPIHAVGAVDRVRLEFTCEFDDFATDTPLNRLLKAAANRIALSPLLGWSVRRRALAIIARMEDGGPL